MNIIADTHTHTVASSHAHSTLLENLAFAREKGLKAMACTEHGPELFDAPDLAYFRTEIRCFPDSLYGVKLLRGCEANVKKDGSLDIPANILSSLDLVIASMHSCIFTPDSEPQVTDAWLTVAKNPDVDIIGHLGNNLFICDYETVIKAFKEYEKVVEINSSSFICRPGSRQNCREIVKLCMKYGVNLTVSSDAHIATEVGAFEHSIALLEELSVPQELVINSDFDRFMEFVHSKSPRKL